MRYLPILALCLFTTVQAQSINTEEHRIRVTQLTTGLQHPWGLAFLPDGRMLVTERAGRLRVISKDFKLEAAAIEGLPTVAAFGQGGLMDIALHPKFAENKWLYFTYTKDVADNMVATTLGRGRLEGNALVDVKDLLVCDPWMGDGGSPA